jgi:hypothetical protein
VPIVDAISVHDWLKMDAPQTSAVEAAGNGLRLPAEAHRSRKYLANLRER